MAYKFAAASTQCLSANSSPLGTGQLGDHSISLWVNEAASASGTQTTAFSISRSSETSGANNPSILIQNNNGAALYILRANTSPSSLSWNSTTGGGVTGQNQGGTAFDSTWHHVCATLSGAVYSVYVDGSSVATGNAGSVPAQTGMDRLGIGALVRGNIVSHYSGSIADVGVWSVALNAAEIRSLAKCVACRMIRPQSLVFYAPLIRQAIDMARGLALTNNNTATAEVHPRIYA